MRAQNIPTRGTSGDFVRGRFAAASECAAARPPGQSNHAVAGDAVEGTILYSRSASRLMEFNAPAVRLERAGVEITGPAGIEQTFQFRCEQTSSA